MRKRRKVLVILGLIALVAVCFVTLWPRDEPKYKGRYLSDWMALRVQAQFSKNSVEMLRAEQAIRAIGTNGLPYFLEWMRSKTPKWQLNLARKLPDWLIENSMVKGWLIEAQRRTSYGSSGIRILGTNAVSAIPALRLMLNDADGRISLSAAYALAHTGVQAIPVLKETLADTNQLQRWRIVVAFGRMIEDGHTNLCLPLIIGALDHEDPSVRDMATNTLEIFSPTSLTNRSVN